jgi:hypothetical protein
MNAESRVFEERAMKIMKRALMVVAVCLVAIATTNAQEQATRVRVRIRPVVHMTGLLMQVENVSASRPAKDELLAGTEKFAQGASSVTEINLDPTTMSMIVSMRHGRDADLASKLNLMSVRSYTYDKPGMYSADDVEAFRKRLEDGSWSCPIRIRGQNGTSEICSRSSADHVTNELVIFSANPQKVNFIHVSGKMTLEELNEASRSTGGLAPHISQDPRIHIRVPNDCCKPGPVPSPNPPMPEPPK